MITTVNTPFKLFFDQLRDLYSMEVQHCESIPRLVSLCTNDELCALLVNHAHLNRSQIEEIAAIFERHGESPGEYQCKTMAGMIEVGTAHLERVRSPHTRNLMMIAHCLRIEYYEMAVYKITTMISGMLGWMREPAILSELMQEEKDIADALMLLEPNLFENPALIEYYRSGGIFQVRHVVPPKLSRKTVSHN